jgi:hypothetical protein
MFVKLSPGESGQKFNIRCRPHLAASTVVRLEIPLVKYDRSRTLLNWIRESTGNCLIIYISGSQPEVHLPSLRIPKQVGVNFINILRHNFLYKSALHSFSLVTLWLCN